MQLEEHTYVVVACSNIEDRTSLIHILESLSLEAISCCDLDQVHEVLSRRNVPIVFCDEHLSEGCFRDLVSADTAGRKASRVVVTIRTGEWDKYLQVMRLGAYDASDARCIPPMSNSLSSARCVRINRKYRIGRRLENAGLAANRHSLSHPTSSGMTLD